MYSVFNAIGGHPLDSYTAMHVGVRDMWLSHGGQPPGGIVGRIGTCTLIPESTELSRNCELRVD